MSAHDIDRRPIEDGIESENPSSNVHRRKYLKAVGSSGLVTSSLLAGCGSNGGGDGGTRTTTTDTEQELGEQVETVIFHFWPNAGFFTKIQELVVPGIKRSMEQLGLDVKVEPVQITEQLSLIRNDDREVHLTVHLNDLAPSRIDPFTILWRKNALWAGANGQLNMLNYASCEYSMAVYNGITANTLDERRQHFAEAQRILSEDAVFIPLFWNNNFSVVNTNEINLERTGKAGMLISSYRGLTSSDATTGGKRANGPTTWSEAKIYLNITLVDMWAHMVYSPLLEYDENYEIAPAMAKSYPEVSNGGKTYTYELRDGTFHNGEPVTAEDAAWTYKFISDNADVYPVVAEQPYESVEVIDEKTVQFNLSNPATQLPTAVHNRFGIMPKQHLIDAGIKDSPKNPDIDEIIGCGPYQVSQFEQGGSQIRLEPWDDHPVYSPTDSFTWRIFEQLNAAVRAFENGNLNIATGVTPNQANNLNQNVQNAEIVPTLGFHNWFLQPQVNYGPMKHKPLRLAISYAIDRQQLIETSYFGQTEPQTFGLPLTENHPWVIPEEDRTTIGEETANVEKARQILQDNGFGWDSDGRLHYPVGADLDPLWPKGSQPKDFPEKWPCVENMEL